VGVFLCIQLLQIITVLKIGVQKQPLNGETGEGLFSLRRTACPILLKSGDDRPQNNGPARTGNPKGHPLWHTTCTAGGVCLHSINWSVQKIRFRRRESTMPYAILRFQKCKSGSVSARCAHNERKKEAYKSNPDIDAARISENYHFIQPNQTYSREAKRMIQAAGCKTRSNSTIMVETLITASPGFMNALPPREQWEYFQKAFDFMEKKIGRDNIISAVVHSDEKTLHLHLSFCPITPDKKLLRRPLEKPAKTQAVDNPNIVHAFCCTTKKSALILLCLV